MKLSIGIVGLPNVGKSTLFKILTKQEVHIANYPFATIDPNIGVVSVPDGRVERLAELSRSKKIVPAVVEFYDIAGLVKGANQGEGLGNQFLAHIRECQAIVQIVRCFSAGDIVHVEGKIDPMRDVEIIKIELILKDLETVEKRMKSLEAETRAQDKKAMKNLAVLQEVKKELENSNLLLRFQDEEIVQELHLLSAKRQLFLLNGTEHDVSGALKDAITALGADYLVFNLAEAEDVSELIRKAYKILNLISFFTTGEDETRAWTITRETKAPQAAGVIHTDFEKKFIRAEVVHAEKLLAAGGWSEAKQKGWLRLEGKEYVVQDGDVMVIRHG